MAAKAILFLVAGLLALATAEKVVFKDCGSKTGKLMEVDLSPCPQEPCVLKHNTTVTISLTMSSMVNTTKVTALIHGIIDRVPVPFPLPETDGCKCGVKCPVKAGDQNTYTYGLAVDPSYPLLKLIIQYELKDDQGMDLACALVPVMISN